MNHKRDEGIYDIVKPKNKLWIKNYVKPIWSLWKDYIETCNFDTDQRDNETHAGIMNQNYYETQVFTMNHWEGETHKKTMNQK